MSAPPPVALSFCMHGSFHSPSFVCSHLCVCRWAGPAFGGNTSVRNGCIPGTPSAYMVVCMDMSVDQDVDIVFSEYIL